MSVKQTTTTGIVYIRRLEADLKVEIVFFYFQEIYAEDATIF